MEKLSVIGCGTMGHSIALSAAWGGVKVSIYGVDERDIQIAKTGLQNKLRVMVDNGLFSAEQSNRITKRISFFSVLKEAIETATYIIEAIPENVKVKKNLYKELEKHCCEEVVIASNTSGLTPSVLAEDLAYPERFVVTHFWNPGHLIPLVEVVSGKHTSEKTIDRTMRLMKQIDKHPILVQKEIPGFIGNRLQYALFREAQALLDAGVATKEDIDAAVKYSIGRRLPVTGPLMSADLGGLDVFSAISNYLFEDLSDDKKSGMILTQLVNDEKLGDKTGEGFYQWNAETSIKTNAEREQMLIEFLKKEQQR